MGPALRHARKPTLIAIGSLLMSMITPANVQAQNEHWQMGTTPSFSSGKYGTDSRTEVLHTPITARRLFDDGDIAFVFPMTCIRGSGGVTVVNGTPVRTDQTRTGATGATSGRTGGAESGRGSSSSGGSSRAAADTNGSTPAPSITTCGIGDIIVRVRYYLVDERRWIPTIALRGHVKAPTASDERGLGTGRPDEGVGLEVSRTIAAGLIAMVDGGYTIIGQPAAVDFNNTWWYDVGLGQSFAKGVVDLSAFFEDYGSIVPGLPGAREVLAGLSVKVPAGWRLQLTGEIGLSDGAPERGLTFGASRRF